MMKHGAMRGNKATREYSSWKSMKHRCYSASSISYPEYGGRGITVCAQWVNSFEHFLLDMGPRPTGTTLDRINVDGNYEPSNCRWATAAVQNRNKTTTRRFTIGGKTQCLADWAREYGLHVDTVHRRIKQGWPIEEALLPPNEADCHDRLSVAHTWTSDKQISILEALSVGAKKANELPGIGGGKQLRRMVERGLIQKVDGNRMAPYVITAKGIQEMKMGRWRWRRERD